MTERRLPGGFNTADQNDLIQKAAGGLWVSRGPAEIIIPGRFLLRSFHGAAGIGATHNLQAQTTKFRVFGHAGGGGGGGVDGSGAGTAGIGTAGQAGGYFDHIYTVSVGITSFTYNIGAGGGGGNGTGAGAGGSGLSTQVTYNAVTVGSNGGVGGSGALASSGFIGTFRAPATGAGGVIGSPDINITGQPGGYGTALSDTAVVSGVGGTFMYATGGDPVITTALGLNGNFGHFGGGGSGAVCGNNTGEPDGGAGGDGFLIVEEYS